MSLGGWGAIERPPAPPITFYDLLRRLAASCSSWESSTEHQEALELIAELERIGAFGTLTDQAHTTPQATVVYGPGGK